MESNALALQVVGSSVERLKRIIGDRYGKDLQLRTLIDLGDQSQDQEFVLKGEDLHVAIKVEDNYLGTVVIPKATDLTEAGMRSASQVVRMIMEPTLYNWYLERQENNLRAALNVDKELTGVQILESEGDSEFSVNFADLAEGDLFQDEFEELEPQVVSNVLLVQSQNPITLKKVALQIHEIGKRWALVPLQDIQSGLNSLEDLIKLGEMTILIEDIEKVDPKIQQMILEYVSVKRSEKEPLFIACTAKSTRELMQLNLNSKLIEELAINAFEADRAPMDFAKLKEVLSLFFFKPREVELDS